MMQKPPSRLRVCLLRSDEPAALILQGAKMGKYPMGACILKDLGQVGLKTCFEEC